MSVNRYDADNDNKIVKRKMLGCLLFHDFHTVNKTVRSKNTDTVP